LPALCETSTTGILAGSNLIVPAGGGGILDTCLVGSTFGGGLLQPKDKQITNMDATEKSWTTRFRWTLWFILLIFLFR